MSRPLEIWSRLVSVLAVTTGFRSGSTKTPVPSFILVVRAAIAIRMDRASKTGKAGSTPNSMWSHTQRDSKPSSSARWA